MTRPVPTGRQASGRSKPGKIGRVVSTLGATIARGEFPPGAVLPPEHHLEQRCGAGRGVVREAMKILATKGMVSVQPRTGTRVLPRSSWGLLDPDVLHWIGTGGLDRELLLALDETRRIIEPAAAALAAQRATPGDKARIADAFDAMVRDTHDLERATAADKRFHLAILDATHNPVLGSFRAGIEAILTAVFSLAMPRLEGNLPNHGAILHAIGRGDAEAARAAMEQVLGYTGWLLAPDGPRGGPRDGP